MPGFILRRLIALVPVVIGASVFAFVLAQIAPGDVTSVLLGPYANPEQRDALRQELALDQPAPVQYVHWLGNAAQGDLGTSIQLQQPVTDVLSTKFKATLLLGATSFALALVLGIGAGLISALRYQRPIDRGVQAAVGFLAFMPVFWLGVVLIYVFSVRLGWLPSGGMEPPGGGGGVVRAGAVPPPPGARHGGHPGRDHRPQRARGVPRAAAVGLHADRARQGPEPPDDPHAAPVAGLVAGDPARRGAPAVLPARREHRVHRGRLQLARHRPAGVQRGRARATCP